MVSMQFLILCVVALVISAIGFYRFVWFISLGYGFSMAGIGIALLVMFGMGGALTWVTAIMAVLLIGYGLRLGGYLLIREQRSAAYQRTMKNEIKDGSGVNPILKIVIWLVCALLYVCESSPLLFRLQNHAPMDAVAIIGMIVMLLGIVLESASDYTKNRFKKTHPQRFCDVGPFRLVRCPNYLGEVLTWTGMFVSGVTALSGVWQWVAAIAGWVCIVWIMFGGARRLELRQNKNYGNDPEYQSYVSKTPILIPFVPLYSVAKYKWLVG
ncbi:steroid reductase [Bifidobacterium sp. DSM 109957]|uniref:Steroid reductase n=2 Tax=Bifidobacterium oedipodis TaxID=2675322 RepID=A0A7Y0EMT2_9BIFI|nr:steroid reductase [Bifidobacterium sp. DSM 109957]